MEKKDILKIVKDAFDRNVFASGCETVLGLEYSVEGKDDFLKEVSEELTQFLKKQRLRRRKHKKLDWYIQHPRDNPIK